MQDTGGIPAMSSMGAAAATKADELNGLGWRQRRGLAQSWAAMPVLERVPPTITAGKGAAEAWWAGLRSAAEADNGRSAAEMHAMRPFDEAAVREAVRAIAQDDSPDAYRDLMNMAPRPNRQYYVQAQAFAQAVCAELTRLEHDGIVTGRTADIIAREVAADVARDVPTGDAAKDANYEATRYKLLLAMFEQYHPLPHTGVTGS